MKNKLLVSSLKPFGVDILGLDENAVVERKSFNPTLKVMEEEESTAICSMSTESVDADGDMVIASGCDLSRYSKNPVVCWSHDYSRPPIGKATEILINSKSVDGKIKFAPTAMGQEIFKLVKGGFLKTCSVGFITNKALVAGSKECKEFCKKSMIDLPQNCKRVITEWMLLENSMVCIPSNADALVQAVSAKSIVLDEKLQKELGIEQKEVKEVKEVKGVEEPPATECEPSPISRPMNPAELVQLAINDAVNLLTASGYQVSLIPPKVDSLIVEPREAPIANVIDVPSHAEAIPNPLPSGTSNGDNGAAACAVVQSGSEPIKTELPDNTEESIKPAYVVVRRGDMEVSIEMVKELKEQVLHDIELVKQGKII